MLNNCGFKVNFTSTLDIFQIVKRLLENRVVILSAVPSTNQYIIDNLKYMQSGDVCVTDNQTHGRGRYGKYWITPNAQGIALSMYWKINRESLIIVTLSLIVGFIVVKVLQELGVYPVQIKWPNDLYMNNRKLGGVLIEIIMDTNKIIHVIIGIGINISICNSVKLTMKIGKNWIDLKNIGIVIDYNIFVADLIKRLRYVMKQFECDPYMLVNSHYSSELDYLYNKFVAVFFNDKINYGTVIGIGTDGVLLVQDKFGIIHKYLKDNVSVYKI